MEDYLRSQQQDRPWVAKFKSGEYVRSWNGFDPFYLISPYSSSFGDESEFSHCAGSFYGIGDVEWWIAAELEGLSPVQEAKLLRILARNKAYEDIHDIVRSERASAFLNLDPTVVHQLSPVNYVAVCLRACEVVRMHQDLELLSFVLAHRVYELIDLVPLLATPEQLMSARKLQVPQPRVFTYWHLDMQGKQTYTSFDATADPIGAAHSLFRLMDFCGEFIDLSDYHIKNLEDTMVDEFNEHGHTMDYADLCRRFDKQKAQRVLLNAARGGHERIAHALVFQRCANKEMGDRGWFADTRSCAASDVDDIIDKYKQDAGR